MASAGSASIVSAGSGTSSRRGKRRRMRLLGTIDAHDHAVSRMVIGGRGDDGGGGRSNAESSGEESRDDGYTLATASSNGTTIRVFGLPGCERLWEWHRGTRPCQFHSISWNGSLADRLVAYGSRGTIHVFGWEGRGKGHGDGEGGEGDKINDPSILTDFQSIGDSRRRSSALDYVKDENRIAGVSKPFFRRVGRSLLFRRHSSAAVPSATRATLASNAGADGSSSGKHRSYAKIKPQFAPGGDLDGGGSGCSKPSLVVALLNVPGGQDVGDGGGDVRREDTLVVCSSDGELRQYSVRSDGTTEMSRMENVFNVVRE